MPHDNDNSAHLFYENDSIGPDPSLLLRPLRQLLTEGKPAGPVAVLTVPQTNQQNALLGVLGQTGKNRLVFWPPFPSGVNMVCAGEAVGVVHHVTLEYPSEKIHVTAYDVQGRPIHRRRRWKTRHFPDSPVALWFWLLVRVSVLSEQDAAVQQRVKVPKTDKKRREEEFTRYMGRLSLLNVSLPPREADQDYIWCGFYLAPDLIAAEHLLPSMFPTDALLASQIEGCSAGKPSQIGGRQFRIGGRTVGIATACPPGKLRSAVAIGFFTA